MGGDRRALGMRLIGFLAAAVAQFPSALEAGSPKAALQPSPQEQAREAASLVAQARDLVKSGDYVWALALLRRAVRADPSLGDEAVGRMERRLDALITGLGLDSDSARRVALRKAGGPAGASAERGVLAFVEGSDAEAILYASVAVGEDPKTEAFRSLLSLVERETGIHAASLDLVPREALVQRKLHRAEQEFFAGRYSNAARECQDVVWLDPTNAFAWTRLGSSWWKAGKREKATQAYQRALALDPDNARLRRFMRAKGLPASK